MNNKATRPFVESRRKREVEQSNGTYATLVMVAKSYPPIYEEENKEVIQSYISMVMEEYMNETLSSYGLISSAQG